VYIFHGVYPFSGGMHHICTKGFLRFEQVGWRSLSTKGETLKSVDVININFGKEVSLKRAFIKNVVYSYKALNALKVSL
jgi:hypothetical protein